MKETKYANGRYPGCERNGVVRYLIQGNQCVFSGMSGSAFMSTVNAAEYVIEAIAEAEGIAPDRLDFFDLHTHRGYTMLQGAHDFMRLDKVRISGELRVTRWTRCKCPQEILRAFEVFTN